VGLSLEELSDLARDESEKNSEKCSNSMKSVKVSRRDMAYVISKKLNGGTTVAGTVIVANMLGINVFATGGIGKITCIRFVQV